jgi:predicted kinase
MQAFITVGAPGSGKTTYCDRFLRNNFFIIEGDAVRTELFGSYPPRGQWGDVWVKVEELVEDNCGFNIVLDGTFETPDLRSEAIWMFKSYGYENVDALVFDRPLEVCLERNSNRRRKVPSYIIEEKHKRVQKHLPFIETEGFDSVKYI